MYSPVVGAVRLPVQRTEIALLNSSGVLSEDALKML